MKFMCRLNKLMLILCVLFLFWVVQRREAWSALESEEKVPRGRTVQSESRMKIFSAHWKLNTPEAKIQKKLKRENVESSYRWSILEQLSNIRGVSRATRTEHVYIFNRTVRSTGSLTFFQENGKWEWLVLHIIQILDQLPLIFGEKQPHMNNIKSFRQGFQWPNAVRLTLLARDRRSSVSADPAYH